MSADYKNFISFRANTALHVNFLMLGQPFRNVTFDNVLKFDALLCCSADNDEVLSCGSSSLGGSDAALRLDGSMETRWAKQFLY